MVGATDGSTYDGLCARFAWQLPAQFNIGVACVDRWPAQAPALVVPRGAAFEEITFGAVRELTDRLGNALRALGVAEGDRVAVVLPQSLETAVAHAAAFKIGAVSVPMSVLFGEQALEHRLRDSGAVVVFTDTERLDRVAPVASDCGATVVVAGTRATAPHLSFDALAADGSSRFTPAVTGPDTPALLIYTSGTTGPPKGALHGHRVLLGHQPGLPALPRPLPTARRPVLDARRLGVDRRPVERALLVLVPRPPDRRRIARRLRPGVGRVADRRRRRPQHVPAADGAPVDARRRRPRPPPARSAR